MPSETFDDEEDRTLAVLSGSDLLGVHHGFWPDDEEAAERSTIDKWRGLVLAQVAVLEDVVDEIILYVADPADEDNYRLKELDWKTIGTRVDVLEELLRAEGLVQHFPLERLRAVIRRRNVLAHGSLYSDVTVWMLYDRRRRTREPVYLSRLRADLDDAQECFLDVLRSLEVLVEVAPWPRHFAGGEFLTPPTP